MKTATATAIRIAGSDDFIRSRQRWGSGDYLQTAPNGGGVKIFASQRSAQQWINRYSASILPPVWGRITLREAADRGLLEVISVN
jgi:hypothetical protein